MVVATLVAPVELVAARSRRLYDHSRTCVVKWSSQQCGEWTNYEEFGVTGEYIRLVYGMTLPKLRVEKA